MSPFILFIMLSFHLSFAIDTWNLKPNITVGKKGSRNFTTIKEAIDHAPTKSMNRFVIHIKRGVYREHVLVPQDKCNITVFGDGMGVTVITGDRSNRAGFTTDETATVTVVGEGFMALNLTIQNTAGPQNEQAVALKSNSPHSAYIHLGIQGYQDTLLVNRGPQYYRNCFISGTVDFIFGEGPAVFQFCDLHAREAPANKTNVMTANGCTVDRVPACGFSFHMCTLTGEKKLLQPRIQTPTYLGRPWKDHSKTVFMDSTITKVIVPVGWLDWKNYSSNGKVFYGEYNNAGRGAAKTVGIRRVGWVHMLKKWQAEDFTVDRFIRGNQWLPPLGIGYHPGLKN